MMKAKNLKVKKNRRQELSANSEYSSLAKLLAGMPKSPRQRNGLFLSDCEILKLDKDFLCLSTDSLAEEMDIGLYRQPFTWGWMTVASSVSDLAASGGQALGILLADQWPYDAKAKEKLAYYRGIRTALRQMKLPLLGGDSGSAASHSHTATIVGLSSEMPLTRVGARPGDLVVALGKKQGGLGPALAFEYLFKSKNTFEPKFRPKPNWKLAARAASCARASIDSSDGIVTALDTIGRINKVGFNLQFSMDWVHGGALAFCRRNGLHPLLLLLGNHGDFQTLFFVPRNKISRLKKITSDFVILGDVVRAQGQSVFYEGFTYSIPVEKLAKSPRDAKGIKKLIKNLNKTLLAQESTLRVASGLTKS